MTMPTLREPFLAAPFRLTDEFLQGGIVADYHDGVLELHVPKPVEQQSKKTVWSDRPAQRAGTESAAHRGPRRHPGADALLSADVEDGAAASELELMATRAHADVRAREELIERLLPLVRSLPAPIGHELAAPYLATVCCKGGGPSRRRTRSGRSGAGGNRGLLRALQRYEPARGTPFRVWAAWWVRQALQEARSDFIRPLRLPPVALRQLVRLKVEHERIYASEQRDANVEELSARVNIDRAQAGALLSAEPVRQLEERALGSSASAPSAQTRELWTD
jgi:Sigma-70 region 2